jgi:oligopeptide/dipeptide ABC transporter ATP-binding protein
MRDRVPTTPDVDGNEALLRVDHLEVTYRRGRGELPVHAVDGVSFTVSADETVGLVGESGSGKTTIGRAILGLAPVSRGTIAFAGVDITRAGYGQRRALSAHLQAVFQDPYSSLNPTRTIGQTLGETLRAQRIGHEVVAERVAAMLERVGLTPDAARRYPSRFSGGQRQRIAIARALIAHPRLVICDEPTSALDLSVQAQVLNLLRELQHDFGLSYLFIAHDLAVVRHLSRRIIVLYGGRVMEQGDAASVYANPIHPYTRELLAAAPVPDPDAQSKRRAARTPRKSGVEPQIIQNSCPFAPRCVHSVDICRTSQPPLELTPDGSLVACHRWHELTAESPLTPVSRRDAQASR